MRQKDEKLNPTRWARFLFILCCLWGIESAGRFPWKLSFGLLFYGRFVPAVFCLHRLVDLFFRFLPAPSVVCFFFDYSLVPVLFAVFFLLHHRLTYFLHTGAILYSSGASRSKILDRLTYVLNTRAIWYSSGASRSIILARRTYFLHTGAILYSSGASRSNILDRLTYFLNTRVIWYSSGASRSIILDRLTYFLHTGAILYSSGASRSTILDRLTYFLNTRAIWYSSGASRSIILDHWNLCFGSLFNSSMHIIIAFL